MALHLPESEAEVVALVKEVGRRGQTLRVVGAGHSWTDIACTDGHLLRLERLNRVLRIDRENGLVVAEAGISLRELVCHLSDFGLALPSLGSIAEQTLAGAISTGTHGSGATVGNLSSLVESLRLVTGRGEVVEASREHHPDVFAAARVGLGCLGVITQVTMRCVPIFNLHERCWTLPFDEALRQMQTLADTHEFIKFWWLPHTDRIQVFAADRTSAPETCPALTRRADKLGMITPVFRSILWLGGHFSPAIPTLNRLVCLGYFGQRERVERSDGVFNLAMPPRHLEAEFAFAREDGPAAFEQLRAWVEWEQLRVNFIGELRFVAADDIWMSPAYGRDACHIGAYCGRSAHAPQYFAGLEAIAARMGARPHWGKMFGWEGAELRRVFERFDDFCALRDELDPDRVFENAFSRRVFG
ncbi:L-gulonolactone oxidase [Bradymonas sediminis]|nr:L-gulonolactone oxidase [Bradymonas sediminis]